MHSTVTEDAFHVKTIFVTLDSHRVH